MRKRKYKDNRTILEFLWKMPQPYQDQAIKNGKDNLYKDFVGKTIKDALMSAFVWSDSPEGSQYWKDFIDNYLL